VANLFHSEAEKKNLIIFNDLFLSPALYFLLHHYPVYRQTLTGSISQFDPVKAFTMSPDIDIYFLIRDGLYKILDLRYLICLILFTAKKILPGKPGRICI